MGGHYIFAFFTQDKSKSKKNYPACHLILFFTSISQYN